MPPEIPIGIDLGTTNSAVARVDVAGRSVMIPNNEGEILTPSVVLFNKSEVVVGKEARSAAVVMPDRVAEWVKRDMGQPAYSRPIGGQYLPPEVIQSCILRKLRLGIVGVLGENFQAVITVPAYFDEPRRKATADAGEMAGLSVLDIVNEPTAAALAYGESLGYLAAAGGVKTEMTVFVYDLGGGTFDATLLRLQPGHVRTLATDGDVQLGGHDWDERLVDFAARSLRDSHRGDFLQDPLARSRLYHAAVEAKCALGARNRTSIRVEHFGGAFEVPVTRQQFEEMTADLLERTSYTTGELLRAAGLTWGQVDRVLLVGGATRMPMVAEMLQRLTGIVADRSVNPDEAVARGAAIYAGYLLAKRGGSGSRPAFRVTDVNAHSLGVEGIDQQTLRKTNVVLIPRNTPLPAKCTERFVTKTQGQRSIVLQVLEGESSLPSECTAVGRTAIHDLPADLPKGYPVEVTFQYGANGRLTVGATLPGTRHEATLDLERTVGLSGDGIARWKALVASAAGFDVLGPTAHDLTGAADAQRPPDRAAPPAGMATLSPAAAPPRVAPSGSWDDAARPSPVGSDRAVAGERSDRAAPRGTRRLRRWAVAAGGYVVSAMVGLGLGYLVLAYLRPQFFPLPW